MTVFRLATRDVKLKEMCFIESALPDGFWVSSEDEGNFYIRDDNRHQVGIVNIFEGVIVFNIKQGVPGDAFRKAMIQKYPSYDPDRIVWGVFFDWHGMKSMMGIWSDSREEAISRVDEYVRQLSNPVLCSFRAGDVIGMVFISVTSFKLLANGEFSDQDDGPVVIELTNLESSCVEE